MAKTYKNPSIVSGLSVNDILGMDINKFNSLGVSDMRKVVGRLVSAGNKRLRSFERAGESSPATRHIMKSGGVFSTKGKNLNELRSEFIRAKTFLQSETGTRKGWEKVKKETMEGLKKQGVVISAENFNDVWKAYQDLKEMSPEVANRGMKYSVLKEVANMVVNTDKNADEIASTLFVKLDKIYEAQEELGYETNGVSGFFEIE